MSCAPTTPCQPRKWLPSLAEGALSSVLGYPEVTRARPDGAHYRAGWGSERGAREEMSTQSGVPRV